MKNHGWIVLLGLLMTAYLVWAGCNGGHAPVDPMPFPYYENSDSNTEFNPGQNDNGPRIEIGSYQLEIDTDGNSILLPRRSSEIHMDVTDLIKPPACMDCLTCEIMGYSGGEMLVRVRLVNPTDLMAYDVRMVILGLTSSEMITPPDSYTDAYTEALSVDLIHPYYIFESGEGQNAWGPGTYGIRDLKINTTSASKTLRVDFLIDASYPENQSEPVGISELTLSGEWIENNGIEGVSMFCHVDDWQSDIDSVTADLSPLGGLSSTELNQASNGDYIVDGIICAPGTEPGLKTIWVTATSGEGSVYKSINITVQSGQA